MRRRRISRALALAAASALLILSGAVTGVRAQNIDLPEDLRTVRDVRFIGMKALGKRALKAVNLRTRQPSILPWREKPTLRRDYLVADSSAIVSLYRHYGYLDARVRVLLEAGNDPRAARVVFTIREGPLSRVDSLGFSGLSAYNERDLRRALLAQPGRPFDPAFLPLDTARIYSLYQERGHLVHTMATARRDEATPTQIRVFYAVDEGPEYRIGKVGYSAVGDVRESLARRELLLKPGQVFRRTRLDASIERLYKTTLYRQVQVTPLPDSARRTIDFEMRVSERKRRWVDTGVGSGATDRIKLDAAWGNRNLDSRALQGVLDGKLAYDGSFKFHEGRTDATLTEPWLFGTRLTGQFGVFYQQLDDRTNPNFVLSSDARGVNFLVYKELSRIARLTLVEESSLVHQSYGLIGTQVSVVADSLARAVLPRYRANTLRATLERDLRDNKVLPSRGSYQQLVTELAGGPLRGQSSYDKVFLSSTWYRPFNNGWKFAARLSGGVMAPNGDEPSSFSPEAGLDPQVARVPRESRFFVGGVNSIRGWGENSIPPGGGLAMGLANVELRIPLAGPFGIETFLDAGNVWARPQYIRARDFILPWQAPRGLDGDVRYSYGVGARLVLPFGPLRVDLAWGDRPDFPRSTWKGDKRLPFAYQFAIGPSF